MFCVRCGKENPDSGIGSFCWNCGSKLLKDEVCSRQDSVPATTGLAARRDEKKLSREKKILLGVGIALFVLVGISLLPWTPGQAEGAFRPVTRLAKHFLPLAIFGYLLLDRWLRHKR
jgi:hypothetical protein